MNDKSKPKRVYFHIDELSRDSITASALKKTLKKHNIELYYGNRRINRTLLPKFSDIFDIIILPRPSHVSALLNKSTLSKIFIIFTEGVGRYTISTDDVFTVTSKFIKLIRNKKIQGSDFYIDRSTIKFIDNLTNK